MPSQDPVQASAAFYMLAGMDWPMPISLQSYYALPLVDRNQSIYCTKPLFLLGTLPIAKGRWRKACLVSRTN